MADVAGPSLAQGCEESYAGDEQHQAFEKPAKFKRDPPCLVLVEGGEESADERLGERRRHKALDGQVWSLSSFEVSRQLLTNGLNQVSSVSLLMTSSTALANKGLFELTLCPSLTLAFSLSFGETTKEPGCSQVKRPKFLSTFGQV